MTIKIVIKKIKNYIVKVLGQEGFDELIIFFQQVFLKFQLLMLNELRDMVFQVVKELEKTNLSDEEKRLEAIQRVRTVLRAKNKYIKDSIICLVIEMAVQKLKNIQKE